MDGWTDIQTDGDYIKRVVTPFGTTRLKTDLKQINVRLTWNVRAGTEAARLLSLNEWEVLGLLAPAVQRNNSSSENSDICSERPYLKTINLDTTCGVYS